MENQAEEKKYTFEEFEREVLRNFEMKINTELYTNIYGILNLYSLLAHGVENEDENEDEHENIIHNSLYDTNIKSTPLDSQIKESLTKVKADSTITEEFCAICQEKYVLDESVNILPCKHIFHENCIGEWFNTNSKCPSCRLELNID